MAKVYFDVIKRGQRKLSDVPSVWYDQVKALLDAAGLDGEGKPIAE